MQLKYKNILLHCADSGVSLATTRVSRVSDAVKIPQSRCEMPPLVARHLLNVWWATDLSVSTTWLNGGREEIKGHGYVFCTCDVINISTYANIQ